jgi:hypothetical protein
VDPQSALLKYVKLALFLVLVCATVAPAAQDASEQNQLAVLAPEVFAAAPLTGSLMLVALSEVDAGMAGFVVVNAATGESSPWEPDWQPADEGWESPEWGRIEVLSTSPDGEWVCFDTTVMLPEAFTLEYEVMRRPNIAVVCRADGSDARPVALFHLVGGGPVFDFTSDSRRLVGQPMLPCPPTPEGYAAYLADSMDGQVIPYFNYYELETGECGYREDVDISDGYWKCPYSDNFRIENNDYSEHRFSNFETGGILGEYTISRKSANGCLLGWVLPDAMLLGGDTGGGLLYVDGSFKAAPNPGWEVYCWLPDGTYIFRDGVGKEVQHGKVDWSSFTVDWSVAHPELAPYGSFQANYIPLADSSGVAIHDYSDGPLLYAPLSREGAKP